MWVVSAGLVRMCRCCLNRQQCRGSDWQLWMSISLIVTGCYRPKADNDGRLIFTALGSHHLMTLTIWRPEPAVNTRTVKFASDGYLVIPELICEQELAFARELVTELVDRYRGGDPTSISAGVTISEVSQQHPQRNPGIKQDRWQREPFIIGDLLALEPRFARLLIQEPIWTCVGELLECASSDLLFHFCNLTRKPSKVGPAIGWHRDADNKYFASHDGRTLRLLIPLHFMSARNGGTAVVSGSHIRTDTPVETALCPEVAPGACLALHSATLHGGSPNRSEQERDVIVIQFGLCSSILRCKANETLSLSTREELLAFYLGTVEKLIENS